MNFDFLPVVVFPGGVGVGALPSKALPLCQNCVETAWKYFALCGTNGAPSVRVLRLVTAERGLSPG